MKTRKLGKNGPTISEIGFGCMGMSDFYGNKGSRNDAQSLSTIIAALDRGVTFLNTADYYGSGHNELLIREAIKGRNEKPVISVKFGGLRTPAGGFLGFDTRPESVMNFASYSLVRLNVEAIDIYEPGRIHPAIPIEDTIGAIADLIQQGKVKYLGLSEARPDIIRRAHAVHPVTSVEVEYSLATRVIEKELLSTCRELGIGIVAYGVLSRGLLSGTLTGTYDPTDFRSHAPRFTGENFESNKEKVEALQELAGRKNCTPSQICIAWVLQQGEDILPLIGTTNQDRLEENLNATQIHLSDAELRWLNDTFPDDAIAGSRYDDRHMGLVVN